MGFWKHRELIRESQRLHSQERADVAGDLGEQQVKSVVDQIVSRCDRRLGVRTFSSLRVPQIGSTQCKYEIDLLVAGPYGLLGLEAKNWGGSLDLGHGGKWERVTSVGESLEHACPLSLVERKMQAVAAYVAAKGVVVPPACLSSFVVLTNRRLKIGPGIERLSGVVPISALANEIRPLVGPGPPGFWRQVARMLGLDREQQPPVSNIHAVMAVLEQLPTWDRVVLHGGKVLKGDIKDPALKLASGSALSREHTRDIKIIVARSGLAAWLTRPKARWTDYAGKRHAAPLSLDSSLRIMLAGQRQEEQVRLASVVSIEFGYRDHSYFKR